MKRSIITSIVMLFIPILVAQRSDVNFQCTGQGKDNLHLMVKCLKAKKAGKEAVKLILFKGIESKICGVQSPLLDGDESVRKFSVINKAFFGRKGDYQKFVSVDGTTEDGLDITLNKKLLKDYLIQKKIIKPLNHGF